MKIIVDTEGKQAISGLIDVALKAAGLQNLNAVNAVLNSLEDYVEPKGKDEKEQCQK